MKLMTLEQIVWQCPTLKRNIERANLVQYWGEYLSSYDPDNSDLLQAALEYAAHGWHVFPCSPADKTPLTRRGFKNATRDPEAIKKFWRKHPNAMIGVACGEKSGVWCLDLDAPTEKNPIDGREELKRLQSSYGADSGEDTHTHITPGGGRHKIYKWRTDHVPVTNREGSLKGKHINVRGEGGYFIACGSVNSDGVAYSMANPDFYFQIEPAPDWLHDLIEGWVEYRPEPSLLLDFQDENTPDQRTISERVLDSMADGTYQRSNLNGTGVGYAKSALNRECAELATTTIDRNIRLNNAAMSMGRFVKSGELAEAEVIEALLAASETNGLNKDDGRRATLATIKSGMRAAVARIVPAAGAPTEQEPAPPGQEPRTAKPAKGWPFKSAKDFRTTVTKVWYIKGVIAPNEVSNWCGAPKSGKSALVGDLAMHFCAGRNWRGYRSKQSGGVIYFALERADLVERRWNAQAAEYGLCPGELPFTVVDWTIDMIHESCVADFIATIGAVELATGVPVKMIVIDTSAKAIAAGGGDENHAKDKNIMRANIRRVMRAIGDLHVALVSHTGKDVEKGERGSNAGLGDDDILITLDGKTANVAGRNDGPTGPLTTYAITSVVLGVDEDGDKVDIGIIAADTPDSDKEISRAELNKSQRRAMELLERCIVDEGVPAPVSSEMPNGIGKVVTREQWRHCCINGGLSGGTKESSDKAFRRSMTDLVGMHRVGTWKELVWIAYEPI
jgi:hypothetical protein